MQKNKESLKKTIYYFYFTEYLLFSKKYKSLLEEGLLDIDIKSGYLYELCYFANNMISNNIYPIFIIERFFEFTSLLEKHVEDEVGKEIVNWLKTVLSEQSWNDATEVYYREYTSRYATVASSKNFDMISLEKLEVDIQRDFQYLNLLFMDHRELEVCIGTDFPFFLNKLLIDFPQIIQDKHLKNKIIRIMKERDFEDKEKYIHLFQDKTNYKVAQGFDLERVEIFYSLTVLKKILTSKDIQKELEQVSSEYFYHSRFILAMDAFLEEAETNQSIMERQRDNLKELLFYMRSHLKDTRLYNQDEIVCLVNRGLHLINLLSPSEDIIEYTKEYIRRIGNGYRYLFLSSFKREEVNEHLRYLIQFAPQVFDYLLGKIDKDSFLMRNPIYESEIGINYIDKDIVMTIEYLFKNYPRMFFDDTIYRRTESLLETIHSLECERIKRKIYRIRRER